VPVSQAQIAQHLGISQRTVSAALSRSGRVSGRRREEILRAADELGYQLNTAARAQRTRRFDAVGLVLSEDEGRSHLPRGLFDGIHDALMRQHMHLAVAKLPDAELAAEGAFPRIVQTWCCDGLLINYTDRLPHGMEARLAGSHVPCIWINCKRPTDCVHYDDFQGSYEATRQLLALRHQRILYLDFVSSQQPQEVHYSRLDRREGYVAAMAHSGLQPVLATQWAGTPPEQRLDALVQMLSSPDRPTAILTFDSGQRVLYAAALVGLQVPRDLSIVEFSELRAAGAVGEGYLGRRISQAGVPTALAGERAVDLLIQKITDPARTLPPVALPLQWVEGQTTGPVPDAVRNT
jgi:LacI family transcriptional regulator